MSPDPVGLSLCARYAYPPNSYHYCGPDKQNDLAGYIQTKQTDKGLAEILDRFETLYPYLVLIASENRIRDPFDRRVVSAYWLGGKLLSHISKQNFYRHISEFILPKVPRYPKKHPLLVDSIISGLPFHTFHVLNICMRTGRDVKVQTLKTMDSCRISWGQIVDSIPEQVRHKSTTYIVNTRPLIMKNTQLYLGKNLLRHIQSIDTSFTKGDWVSMHWGIICDRLSSIQRHSLMQYTQYAIDRANLHHQI